MRCVKVNPCKECPFMPKAVKGWLGPDTADQVMQKVHGEGGYVCHTSIAGGRQANARQCTGAILHANKSFKIYRNPKLRELQDKWDGKGKEFNVLDRQQFEEHHKNSFVEMVGK